MDNKLITRCFLEKKNDCFDDTIADTECNPSIETIFIKDNVTGISTPTDYVEADNFDWQSLLALLMWILAVLYSRCVMGLVQMNIFIFSCVCDGFSFHIQQC